MGGSNKSSSSSVDPTSAAEPTPAPLEQGILVSESLKEGSTQGLIGDATFTADGLLLHDGEGFVRYGVPTTVRGYVEFDVKGLKTNEYHGGGEFKGVLMTMWDGDDGYMYETSGYIYELRIFGLIYGRADASNTLSIRLISGHDWNEGHRRHYFWDENQTYRIHVQWGDGATTVSVNGEVVASSTIARKFRPDNHQIQIGANMVAPYSHRWKETPHDIVISNVVIATFD
jgi:hypothetical protein